MSGAAQPNLTASDCSRLVTKIYFVTSLLNR